MMATATAPVGLVEAARHFHVDAKPLSQLLDQGEAPYLSRRRRGRGWAYEIDLDELGAWLSEHHTCREPGCQTVTLGEAGYCRRHKTRAAAEHEARLLADPSRPWYTFQEVERLSGWSQGAIEGLIDDGTLKAEKKDGRYRKINKAAVDALLGVGYKPRPGVWKRARRTDPDLPARRANAKRRYDAGESKQQIADAMHVGVTTVGRWLKAEDATMRSGAPATKYERLPPRNCAHCEEPMPPKPPSQDRRRNGEPRLFCSRKCAAAARHQARVDAVHARPGWITVAEGAEIIGYCTRYVTKLCEGKRPKVSSELIDVPGQLKPMRAVNKKSLRSWESRDAIEQPKRAKRDGRSAIPADPDKFVAAAAGQSQVSAIMRREGCDQEAAEAKVRERIEDREDHRTDIRNGKLGGAPMQADTPVRADRVARRFDSLRPTLASDRQTYKAIFETEWKIDRRHFPRNDYPESLDYPGLPCGDKWEAGIAHIKRLHVVAKRLQ